MANIFQIGNVYRGDIKLKNLIWDFYGTLLDCLPELITILNRSYETKNGEPFFFQASNAAADLTHVSIQEDG